MEFKVYKEEKEKTENDMAAMKQEWKKDIERLKTLQGIA